jgi:hypothetical protein
MSAIFVHTFYRRRGRNSYDLTSVSDGRFHVDPAMLTTQAINSQPAGAAAAKRRTWDQIVANNPDAVILGGVGVNQGSGNGGITAFVDAFTFDTTTYDFDPYRVATSRDDCKDDGWKGVKRADGSVFRNQGQCIQYANTGK